MDLKETLQSYRKRQGLSQIELAEALDVSRQTVSKWETGSALPSAENLMALGRLYGVPVDALLNGEAAESLPEIVPDLAPILTPPEPRTPLRPRRLWLQILGTLFVFDSLMFWMEMASGFENGFFSVYFSFSPVFRWLGCFLIGLFFAWRDRSTDLNRSISRLIALAAFALGLYAFLLPGPWLWRLYDFVVYLGAGPDTDVMRQPATNSVTLFFAWTLFDEGAFISHCLLIAAFQLGRLRFSRKASPAPWPQPVQSI